MGTFILIVIVVTLWGITSLLAYMEVADVVKKIKNPDDVILVKILFMICGPAFAITTIANAMLDSILPEGWDDDGKDNFIDKY